MPDEPTLSRAAARYRVTTPRWHEVTAVVDAALELPPDERPSFVARACQGDADLLREASRLLVAIEEGDGATLLAGSAAQHVAPVIEALEAMNGDEERRRFGTLARALAGRYTIVGELGRGGMATVYLADDLRLPRQVAIKVVRPSLASVLPRARFLREIDIASRLSHPYILPLIEAGEADGVLYYVTLFVEGRSLRERLAREGPLPVQDAVRLAREVAEALDFAHRQNVVHRDVKPENILLQDGHALVADFGIARAITVAGGERLADTLTAVGLRLGTPSYMSPEQCLGERGIDGRSDVYALGCVLYELLAGEPPFQGPTVETVMRLHVTEAPRDVRELNPAVPEHVAAAIGRALAKERGERWQTAGEFCDELAMSTRSAMPSRPAPRNWPGLWRLVSGAGAGALVLAIAHFATVRSVSETSAFVVEQTVQLTHAPEVELDPALSPDGSLIAYAGGELGRTKLLVRQISGGRVLSVADSFVGVRTPRWSPDGSRLAFEAIDGIYLVPTLGGAPRRVVESGRSSKKLSRAHSPAWSPDGTALAYAADSGIYLLSLNSGASRRVGRSFEPHALSWSPDGAWLAFVSGNAQQSIGQSIGNVGNPASSAISILRASGGTPRELTDRVTMNASPAWMPDGRTLLFVSARGGARDIYALRLRGDGSARVAPDRLTTGIRAHSISVSRDGRRVVYATFRRTGHIWSVVIGTRGAASFDAARPLTRGDQLTEGVALSPDGRWLAFDSDVDGDVNIYRMPADGGEPEPLTRDPGDDFVPAWSPDGRELAFYSMRHGNRDIFVMRADGSAERRVTSSAAQEGWPDWSPDGQKLVYTRDGQILELNRGPEGRFDQPRTVGRGELPRWSPNGRWLAFIASGPTLQVMAANGGAPRVVAPSPLDRDLSTPAPLAPHWSNDSRMLFYLARERSRFWSIRAIPVEGGQSRMLLKVDQSTHPFGDGFATDGHRFFFTVDGAQSDLWMLTLRPR